MNITVIGAGYVGLSLAVLLAQHNRVTVVTTTPAKADAINACVSPIRDAEIENYLTKKTLDLTAVTDRAAALREAEYILVAVPTNYDPEQRRFDTTIADQVIEEACRVNPEAYVVIKSTVPVGYTRSIRETTGSHNILFSPEFLREGSALYDNLYPSRIIMGTDLQDAALTAAAERLSTMLREGALKEEIDTLFMDFEEAEAVKLFSNTYLALRVAFFNELDTFAVEKGMETRRIVEGVCLDPRIGSGYNNPSFGYGGYCLPKDSKQLAAEFSTIPGRLAQAVVEANQTRKAYIAGQVLAKAQAAAALRGRGTETVPVIGIYRMLMKSGSDNFREAAVQDIMKQLREKNVELIIYEPMQSGDGMYGGRLVNDLERFLEESDVILANRYDPCLDRAAEKVYTRDLFGLQ
ncbi:MAG: nucleotide sugar dehydrogenase [Oscillospiraceae bacterium]|nr:nucleotide sugar dehydrogenase [Oscillospiraceae bacterium]